MAKRSIWKGPFIKDIFFKEIFNSKTKLLKTTARNTVILPLLVGYVVHVHTGKIFIPLYINEEMIGHTLGEFIPTRLRHIYKKKKKK
jgi:small subunit ribosomal protein S19